MISGPAGRFVGLRGPFLWVLAGFLAWCAEAGQSFWLAARRRPNLWGGFLKSDGAILACFREKAHPLEAF